MLFYARYSLHFIKLKKWICTWWDSHYSIYSSFFIAVTALFYVIFFFFILFSFWNIKERSIGLNSFLIMISFLIPLCRDPESLKKNSKDKISLPIFIIIYGHNCHENALFCIYLKFFRFLLKLIWNFLFYV